MPSTSIQFWFIPFLRHDHGISISNPENAPLWRFGFRCRSTNTAHLERLKTLFFSQYEVENYKWRYAEVAVVEGDEIPPLSGNLISTTELSHIVHIPDKTVMVDSLDRLGKHSQSIPIIVQKQNLTALKF